MIKRLYAHNFRCLQNFEFNMTGLNSAFLLGKNGSGKTTIFDVIEIFQKIGQGVTSLKELINKSSFSFDNKSLPIEFELDVVIDKKNFSYRLSIEFPEGFASPRVKSENLLIDQKPTLKRDGGQTAFNDISHFLLDWHHIGIPLISVKSDNEPLAIFRNWLRDIIILSPFPRHFLALSKTESTTISREAENVLDWAKWLLSSNPSLYTTMSDFLKFRMPDLEVFKWNNNTERDGRELLFTFKEGDGSVDIDFGQLSDGEKIFFLAATVIAAQKNNSTILCLWDEPDNFIGLVELNHFVTACRKAFEASHSQAQLIMISHNAQVINNFSNHNIFLVKRTSHLSPTRIEIAETIQYKSKTLVDAFDSGELD